MDAGGGSGHCITHVRSTILDLPPSCIEFSPIAPEYFVVGTYNLQQEKIVHVEEDDSKEPAVRAKKKAQSRNGSLVLFKIVDGSL